MRSLQAFIPGPSDLEALVRCVQRCFPAPEGEVMACALGVSAADYLPYTQRVCEKAVSDGLTVAFRHGSEEIAGFLIGEDFASAPVYSEMTLSYKFQPVLCLLEQLDEWYRSQNVIAPGEIFHFYMLGVDPGHARSGLGVAIAAEAERLARARGFARGVGEATGEISQRIVEKLGFSRRFGIEYSSYLFEGETVFSAITRPSHCWLVEKSFR